MFDALRKSLSKAFSFTDGELETLFERLRPVEIEMNGYFLKEGKVCDRVGYVTKGLLMYYHINDGVEMVRDFGWEGDWVTYLKSLSQQIQSDMNIKALEPTTLFTLSKTDMETLFAKVPRLMTIRNHLVEKSFIDIAWHSSQLATLDAEQRYLNLLKEKPALIQRVPQYYIASYLGIKPQSLSRIRKTLNKRN